MHSPFLQKHFPLFLRKDALQVPQKFGMTHTSQTKKRRTEAAEDKLLISSDGAMVPLVG